MNLNFTVDNETSVLNLRNDNVSADLVPVGLPKTIATGSLRPVYSFRHTNGESTLFLTTGNFLFALRLGDEKATPQSVTMLPSEARSAVATGNVLIVMTDDGPYRIDYDETAMAWRDYGLMPEFPVINLKAIETSSVSVATPVIRLSGTYSDWKGDLDDVDMKVIADSLFDVYERANAQAMQSGFFVQPVVARYQLFDGKGTMLYQSAPVLVSAGYGFQAVEALSASVVKEGDYFTAINPLWLRMPIFKVGFDTALDKSGAWGNIVKSVKIIVSPQLHPVDYDAPLSYRMETDADNSHLFRVYMPGVAVGMVPNLRLRRSLTECMAVTVNDNAVLVKKIYSPFGGGLSSANYPLGKVVLSCVDCTSAADECRALDRSLAKYIAYLKSYEHRLIDMVSAPHGFSAATAAAVGDIIIYGGITPLRYRGYPVNMMAVERTSGAWYANAVVEMADGGESVVWYGEGDSDAPLSFSPLLSYPSPDAVSLKITVCYADGAVRSLSVPLTSAGGISLYISDDFLPLSLVVEEDAYVIPAEVKGNGCYPGSVLTASVKTPLLPLSSLDVTQGDIVSVTPAVRSLSSWDFARSHLYLFSTTGIYALSVNAARSVIAANIIDSRGVRSSQAVTVTEYGVCAVASNDLVHILGSRSATLDADTGFEAIGWSAPYQELWCVTADGGKVRIRCGDGVYYRRDIVVDELLSAPDGRLYLRSGTLLLDASREYDPGSIAVEWTKRVKVKPSRVKGISWHVFASEVDMAFSLRGDNGAGEGSTCPMLKLVAKGAVNAPVSGRVFAPPRHFLTLSAVGNVSSDARFSEILMT